MTIRIYRNRWPVRVALAVLIAAVAATGAARADDDGDVKNRDLEKQLEAARGRLENAAREVADLSQQLSGSAMHDVFVGEMFAGGRRAILGINIGSRGEAKVEGVYVSGVSPGGPAEKAGLRAGDVIVAFDGDKLLTGADGNPNAELLRRMREVKPGDKVKLRYLRDGKSVTTDVTTRAPDRRVYALPDGNHMFDVPVPPVPPVPPVAPEPPMFFNQFMDSGLGDLELVTLTPKLGTYFGTEQGALVIHAPSADLKLEEGDVITAIDGRQPKSSSHALRILRSYQPGEKIKLSIMRARKGQTLEVTLPARQRMGERGFLMAPRVEPAVAPAPGAPAAPAAPAVPAAQPAPATDRT